MPYMNSVTIIGYVGADPEQRQARNGNSSKFTVLSVATQRAWKNAEDEWTSKTLRPSGTECALYGICQRSKLNQQTFGANAFHPTSWARCPLTSPDSLREAKFNALPLFVATR